MTCQWVVPESNQTSKVSRFFSYWEASSPKSSATSNFCHASMPSFSTRLATSSRSSTVRGCGSPLSLCTKKAIGTPHWRWRDKVQSGRLAIMLCKRCFPQAGKNSVLSIPFNAVSRSVGLPSEGFLSMLANHCDVAR